MRLLPLPLFRHYHIHILLYHGNNTANVSLDYTIDMWRWSEQEANFWLNYKQIRFHFFWIIQRFPVQIVINSRFQCFAPHDFLFINIKFMTSLGANVRSDWIGNGVNWPWISIVRMLNFILFLFSAHSDFYALLFIIYLVPKHFVR